MLYFNNMSISDSFDRIFKALASPVRRQILDDLRDQPLTTGTLCAHFPELDRCTVMQHIRVHLNAVPIQQIHERWIGPHAERAAALLTRLKEDVEGEA